MGKFSYHTYQVNNFNEFLYFEFENTENKKEYIKLPKMDSYLIENSSYHNLIGIDPSDEIYKDLYFEAKNLQNIVININGELEKPVTEFQNKTVNKLETLYKNNKSKMLENDKKWAKDTIDYWKNNDFDIQTKLEYDDNDELDSAIIYFETTEKFEEFVNDTESIVNYSNISYEEKKKFFEEFNNDVAELNKPFRKAIDTKLVNEVEKSYSYFDIVKKVKEFKGYFGVSFYDEKINSLQYLKDKYGLSADPNIDFEIVDDINENNFVEEAQKQKERKDASKKQSKKFSFFLIYDETKNKKSKQTKKVVKDQNKKHQEEKEQEMEMVMS